MRPGALPIKFVAVPAALAAALATVAVAVRAFGLATLLVALSQQTSPAAAASPAPPAAGDETPSPIATPPIVSGPLRRSDVLLSPRFYRANWLEALRSFSANRIVWTYAGDQLVAEAAKQGIPVQCTIPFWVPVEDADKDEMACVTPDGIPVSSSPDLIFPDVNSDAWRRYILGATEKLVDAGCTSFQQDNAWQNYYVATAMNGCYSAETRTEFRDYLGQASSSKLRELGIAGAAALESAEDRPESAKAPFQAFQQETTGRYHQWLHAAIQAYATSRFPGVHITFSGNFVHTWLAEGKSDWLLSDFDFVLAESHGTRATMPNVLRDMAHAVSGLSGVSGITVPRDDVWLNQRSIATAYALGLTAIVPWDAFVPGKPRFFGDPADFAPLLRVVRTNLPLFDDYVSDQDFYGDYGPVLPAQGTVERVDRTTYPDRTTMYWSGRAAAQEVRGGLEVVVGGVRYATTVASHVGLVYLPAGAEINVGDPVYFPEPGDPYLITIRQHVRDAQKRAIHGVSWAQRPAAVTLLLRREEFPQPPTMLVTPSQPVPTPIAPTVAGDYYVYSVGSPIWAILY